MQFNRAALVAVLVVAGCSGGRQATTTTNSVNQPAESQPSAAVNPAGNLPIYPGAARMRMQMHRNVRLCGTTASITMYAVKDVDPATVSKWYAQRIPDGVALSQNAMVQNKFGSGTHTVIFTPDGSGGITILQVHLASGQIAGIAKAIGVDRTTIGIENFDPPLPHDIVALMQRGAQGDAASKAAARAQIKEKCGGMFSHTTG